MEPSFKAQTSPEASWGAVVGILIIVALLVAGAVYFFLSGGTTAYPAPAVGAGEV